MLLKIYTKIHNYIWVWHIKFIRKKWEAKGKFPEEYRFLLYLISYFPFPSEFRKDGSDDV